MTDWVTIRNLKQRNPKLGTRSIAKILKVSRNTVKKALAQKVYAGYERVSKNNKELSKFSEFIKESYLVKKQKVSVIIVNLRSKGFKGSESSVYRYINSNFKMADSRKRTFERYETLPGEQMQYDWSEYNVSIGDKVVKLYVHCTIFGYLRKRKYDFSFDKKQSTIFDVLSEAFYYFNGVCSRIQVDNATQFVNDAGRNVVWNDNFLNLCGYYGILPTRSLPSHPWSKGKVENPFRYLENHFIKNNVFFSIEDFSNKLFRFNDEVNDRVHGTTGVKPSELFEKEKEHLLPLPSSKFILVEKEYRKVTSDCLISYKLNRYSVPHIFAGQEVWIKEVKGIYLNIYSNENNLIAEHTLASGKGQIVSDKSYYKSLKCQENSSFDKLSHKLRERFSSYKNINLFLELLKKQKGTNYRYQLFKILELFEYYDEQMCESVMEESLKYRKVHSDFIKGLLRSRVNCEVSYNDNPNINFLNFPSAKECKRELKEYQYGQR